MANDFDAQIDYLEQFGSSSVSPFFVYVKSFSDCQHMD